MTQEFAQRFMNQLQETERTGEIAPLAALFAEDAQLQRVNGDTESGQAGIRQFWQEYLSAFDQVRSTFSNVYIDGNTIILEWLSTAQPATEHSFEYRGISILEVADGKIGNFRTYYDSAAFVQARTPSS